MAAFRGQNLVLKALRGQTSAFEYASTGLFKFQTRQYAENGDSSLASRFWQM